MLQSAAFAPAKTTKAHRSAPRRWVEVVSELSSASAVIAWLHLGGWLSLGPLPERAQHVLALSSAARAPYLAPLPWLPAP